jgi:hypothetical protein
VSIRQGEENFRFHSCPLGDNAVLPGAQAYVGALKAYIRLVWVRQVARGCKTLMWEGEDMSLVLSTPWTHVPCRGLRKKGGIGLVHAIGITWLNA